MFPAMHENHNAFKMTMSRMRNKTTYTDTKDIKITKAT